MLSRRLPHDREPNAWSKSLAARRAAGRPLVDLTESNPTRVGLAPEADELAALADPRGARYEPDPRGLASAREAVADYYSSRGVAVAPEHLVLTSATSESYAHLLRLLADPGDVFLVPTPSYPLLEPLSMLENVTLAPYRIAYDGRWHLDLASLEVALGGAPRARAVVVVEPNHPTGSCLTSEERVALERLCERHRLALIADEVFGDFPWGAAPLPTFAGERRVATFVLGGLSKSCGMPQLKLGWIVVAGPTAARESALSGLEWIADLFLSVSTPVQLALPRLLENGQRFRTRVRERIGANRAALERLTREQPAIDVLQAEGGWAAVLRLPASRSGEECSLALLERDVIVHPGHFYDMTGEAYLVLSLIPEVDRFAWALGRLADLVAG